MARVGVLFDVREAENRRRRGENVFQIYIGEILEQAGIPYQWVESAGALQTGSFDLCVAALTGGGRETAETLLSFAEAGGEVIAFGGLSGLADRLRMAEGKTAAPGYARLPGGGPPLRFPEATPWSGTEAGAYLARGTLHHQTPLGPEAGPVFLRIPAGKGSITRWAVDIPSTVVRLQQGTAPVRTDGPPAPDGTGALDDGILKADDGFILDWEWDRAVTPTGQKYFAVPYGDWWREALLRQLVETALTRGLSLPWIDPWPDGAEQVALISLDSDVNRDEHAKTTLELLEACGVPATWCMLEPGYAPGLYARIREAGHELALHFNAYDRDGGRWEEGEFRRQLAWLKQAAGLDRVVSNKNHYTRFEGWSEFFSWCERAGIGSDQTRGPSKRGNVGFLFATCLPYFPLAWADKGNRRLDVLEIGFLTQDIDLGSWADGSIVEPFLDRVAQVRGVAHFLFHPIHLHRDEQVRAALRRVVREAKRRGFTFWTGEAVNRWERARRGITIAELDGGGEPVVTGVAAGAVIRIPLPPGEATGEPVEEIRGVPCKKRVLGAAARTEQEGAR